MLFGSRDMINSIYGAYGSEFGGATRVDKIYNRLRADVSASFFALLVGPASDGICESTSTPCHPVPLPLSDTNATATDYMSCTQLISVSFTFNGQEYAVHPIDMSDYTSTSSQCRGSMQYADNLAAGDVILGSSFLKNV